MPGAWLDRAAMQRASDVVLAGILAAVAVVALINVEGAPFAKSDPPSPWFFPTAVSIVLLVVAVALIFRGLLIGPSPPTRWHPAALVFAAVTVAAVFAVAWYGLPAVAIYFGPSEFANVIALELAIVIALARGSFFRALGMVLLGLLLSTIGINIATGVPRYTMGLEHLADGLMLPIVALGLIVGADGAVCLASPSLYLATYARHVTGWTPRRIPAAAGSAMRVLAAIAIAAAVSLAYQFNASLLDVGVLLLFASLGIACRIFGWSRLVLLVALALGVYLEQNLARALLISRGDPGTFARWPLSLGLMAASCGVLAIALLLSARRALLHRRSPA